MTVDWPTIGVMVALGRLLWRQIAALSARVDALDARLTGAVPAGSATLTAGWRGWKVGSKVTGLAARPRPRAQRREHDGRDVLGGRGRAAEFRRNLLGDLGMSRAGWPAGVERQHEARRLSPRACAAMHV